MGRRTLLLVAAVVVAAIGTTLVFFYASNANDRALADQKPQQVLVAKILIASGAKASDAAAAGSFELKKIPKSAVAPGALSSIDSIKDQVALGTIFPGEQILASKFGAVTSAPASTGLVIPDGDIAISIQLGDPARVAGFVQPGSKVAIFMTVAGAAPPPGQPAAAGQTTRLLLPKAEVIAVGPTTISPPANPNDANKEALPRAIMTLALSQSDAEKVIFASQQGELYFGLLNDKSKVTPDGGANISNLFG